MNQPREPEVGACPSVEDIAAYVDGQLSPGDRAAWQTHFADCERCRELLAEVRQTLDAMPDEEASAAPVVPAPIARRRPLWRWVVPVAAAAAVAVVAMRVYAPGSGVSPELRAIVAAAGPFRATQARLTGGFAYAPPVGPVRAGEQPREVSPELQIAIAQARTQAASSRTPSRLHALGIGMLLEGRYDAAVAALEDAVSGAPQDAATLSDLAAAYLARARGTNRTDDLTRGLDAADRSIAAARARGQKAPIEAFFNRALLLELQGQNARARDAWTEYLTQDGQSGWAAEARDHLQRLSSQ